MKQLNTSRLFTSIFLGCALFFTMNVQAQSPAQSRVAVVSSETKTNIWISDFPRQTSVLVVDADQNIIAIVTTNQYGAAFISVPTSVQSAITAKTINGEVSATNKRVAPKNQQDANVAVIDTDMSNKA